MSRRATAPKREIIPDAKFGDQLVAKFVNSLMLAGKRSTAEKCLYRAFDIIETRFKEEPLDVFKKALDAVKPRVEVKSRRVGGATYQVPVEVRPDRRNALAMRWLVTFANNRKGVPMENALAYELKDAAAGQGNAIKKRDDMHKMAQPNRAFAHFRW